MNTNRVIMSRSDAERLQNILHENGFNDLAKAVSRANDEYYIMMGKLTKQARCNHDFKNGICVVCGLKEDKKGADAIAVRNVIEKIYTISFDLDGGINDKNEDNTSNEVFNEDIIVKSNSSPEENTVSIDNAVKMFMDIQNDFDVYYDHLGNPFESKTALCKKYGKTVVLVRDRLKAGWSFEQALTIPSRHYKKRKGKAKYVSPIDGLMFSSLPKLAEHCGINYKTLCYRLQKGMSLYDAVMTPVLTKAEAYEVWKEAGFPRHKKKHSDEKKVVRDFLERSYDSEEEMCDHFKVSVQTFHDRLAAGRSLEYALTGKERPIEERTDHEGKVWLSKELMCKAYNIDPKIYDYRLSLGWSKKKALTEPLNNKISGKRGAY